MTDIRKPVEDILTDYDIFDPEFIKDPYSAFSEIRESGCPIAHTDRYEGSWLPTRYDDVVAIAQEYETFTSQSVLVLPDASMGLLRAPLIKLPFNKPAFSRISGIRKFWQD
mgnify:CR=1 FL=1